MVKTLVTIELDDATPEHIRTILEAVPRVAVSQGQRPELRVNGQTHPLAVSHGIAPYTQVTARLLAEANLPQQIPLVVANRLTAAARQALEDAGCSYADGTGAAHLEGPGFLLHIEAHQPRRVGSLPAPRGLGAVAVRAIQVMLSQPQRSWSVADLARESGASVGEAHNVLRRLEAEGLVGTTGAARGRREVAQPADLLDWLATVPAARKVHARLGAFLYASDPDKLVTRMAANAHQSETTWAVTGVAAARAMGLSVVTALPVVTVRVSAKPGLLEAATALGAEPVDSGANVMLMADVGDVGTRHAIRTGPLVLAPPVRIWLDMLGEPRGADAAALFREAVLGY